MKIKGVKETDPVICAWCNHRFPPGRPIPLVVPPQGRIVRKRQQVNAVPVYLCRNPDSPHYNHVLYAQATCAAFEKAGSKNGKEEERDNQFVTAGASDEGEGES